MARRVLFVRNDPLADEALLGEVFAEFGYHGEVFAVMTEADAAVDPVLDVRFPDPADYDVIVALGARWHVYDAALQRSWVGGEVDMLRRADAAGVAVLGVCFGGQLLAAAHGGTVASSPHPELGWHRIDTDDATLVGDGPWFQWHGDRWTLPPDAVEIARNGRASQAFRLRRALALQFHPELDRGLLERWIAEDGDGDIVRAGLTADTLRAVTDAQREAAPQRLRTLVRAFLDRVAGQSAG